MHACVRVFGISGAIAEQSSRAGRSSSAAGVVLWEGELLHTFDIAWSKPFVNLMILVPGNYAGLSTVLHVLCVLKHNGMCLHEQLCPFAAAEANAHIKKISAQRSLMHRRPCKTV